MATRSSVHVVLVDADVSQRQYLSAAVDGAHLGSCHARYSCDELEVDGKIVHITQF